MKKRKKMAKKGNAGLNKIKKRKVKVTKRIIKKVARSISKTPKEIGKVFTYYPNISVVAVKLSDKLSLGDRILIKGKKPNFQQRVESMQIEHKPVREAKKGDDVGIRVIDAARQNDVVYRI